MRKFTLYLMALLLAFYVNNMEAQEETNESKTTLKMLESAKEKITWQNAMGTTF